MSYGREKRQNILKLIQEYTQPGYVVDSQTMVDLVQIVIDQSQEIDNLYESISVIRKELSNLEYQVYRNEEPILTTKESKKGKR